MPNDSRLAKPAKPRQDFPLFAHGNGQWAKKVKGRMFFFGVWRDSHAALARWNAEGKYLLEGRTPPANLSNPTLKDLCNRFLSHKQHLVDTGKLTARSFTDYHRVCGRVLGYLTKERLLDDLRSEDFERLRAELAKTLGKVTLGNEIQRIRMLFKYGYDAGLFEKPMRYGAGFKRPSRKTLRLERHAKGPRMFEAERLRTIIKAAEGQLKAMLLLGINAGMGTPDCGNLPMTALDLGGCWLNYPRPKTGVDRRVPLWTETVKALQDVLKNRRTPKSDNDAGLVFVTKRGLRWSKVPQDNPITKETTKLLKSLDMHRPGLGFYALRHTFETIGGEAGDQIAVNHIMGNADVRMSAVYRERISDERLLTVTNHVRPWLWPKAK